MGNILQQMVRMLVYTCLQDMELILELVFLIILGNL